MGNEMLQGIKPPGQRPLGLPVASLFDEDVAAKHLSTWLYPAGTKYPGTGFCFGSRQRVPSGSCLRAHFFLVSQTAVYIFVCVNNLKYEGFALLFTPLDNINYCREPSSLKKEGKKTLWKSCRPCKYLKGHLHLLQNCRDKREQQ